MAGSLPDKFLDRIADLEREEKPKKEEKRGGATGGRSRAAAFARLDEIKEEAEAGGSDEFLSASAGVTVEAVLAWRRARGMKRAGSKKVGPALAAAVDTIGTRYDPVLHVVEEKDRVGNGAWEVPQYILRDSLSYTDFARLVHGLRTVLQEPAAVVASGLGVRLRDIALAEEVWERHLRLNGVTCATCKHKFDPRFGDGPSLCRRCG